MVNKFILAAALLLMSCAPRNSTPEYANGSYVNYRDMYMSHVYVTTHDLAHAKCAADWLMANIAPADLAQLDRYARGEIPASATNYDRVSAEIEARFAHESGKEMLRPYCPDKVDSFKFPNS